MKFLKKLRVVLALLFFIPVLLFFLDFTGKLPLQLHALIKFQWIPALLSLNLGIIGILLILSLLFGRIYCSVLCPLGVFQDVISFNSRLFKKKKKSKFKYSKPQNILRYSFLALTVVFFIFGSSFFVILLDPYSIFGRFASQLLTPIVIWSNNGLASLMNGMDNYAFYKVENSLFVPVAFTISLVFVVSIIIMSWFRGRLYCNTVCPVGSSLGLLSRFSLFRITINESSCTNCGLCEKACKSECIDSKNMIVDESRCVSCFNCVSVCKKASMNYEFRYKKPKKIVKNTKFTYNRRAFLISSGALVSTVALAKVNKITNHKESMLYRKPIMPPGAQNIEHFNTHCTGCQLCVSKCPMQVLKPSFLEYGLSGVLQPHLKFSTHVFCSFECTICSEVCPTNALQTLKLEQKKRTQIGVAKFRRDMCVVYTDEKDCGACSEHCPTQAVHMIPYKNGLTIPEVTEDLCIGCGGCESICPVKPYEAIYVEGVSAQVLARKPEDAKVFDKVIDDFGF